MVVLITLLVIALSLALDDVVGHYFYARYIKRVQEGKEKWLEDSESPEAHETDKELP